MRVFDKDNLIERDAVIGMRKNDKSLSYELHYHKFIELMYITEGKAVECIDGTEYAASAGDMMFIGYGASHSFRTEEAFSYIEIYFSPELVEDGGITAENALALLALSCFDDMRGGADGGKISFSGEDRREVEFILGAMLKEKERSCASSRKIMESYLNILLIKMLDRTSTDETLAADVLSSLKAYIDAYPEEKMTLSTLASKSFYNPSYLSRAFKQKFGISPMEYLRRRRIEEATELLISTDESVDEIMERVGFSDRSSFYHTFSRLTSLTPAEYRQKFKR